MNPSCGSPRPAEIDRDALPPCNAAGAHYFRLTAESVVEQEMLVAGAPNRRRRSSRRTLQHLEQMGDVV